MNQYIILVKLEYDPDPSLWIRLHGRPHSECTRNFYIRMNMPNRFAASFLWQGEKILKMDLQKFGQQPNVEKFPTLKNYYLLLIYFWLIIDMHKDYKTFVLSMPFPSVRHDIIDIFSWKLWRFGQSDKIVRFVIRKSTKRWRCKLLIVYFSCCTLTLTK